MKRIIPLIFALLAIYSASVPAEIHHVPADFNTIQEAVDDCNNGNRALSVKHWRKTVDTSGPRKFAVSRFHHPLVL